MKLSSSFSFQLRPWMSLGGLNCSMIHQNQSATISQDFDFTVQKPAIAH